MFREHYGPALDSLFLIWGTSRLASPNHKKARQLVLFKGIQKIMDITYKLNTQISSDQFIELLNSSSLGERRPIEDKSCMEGMLKNSNLMLTAWCGDQLVGLARSVTDFHYSCYLSDLAVSREFQKHGIGKELQRLTQLQLGPKCKLILLAAPLANDYYAPLGYKNHPRCWVLEPDVKLNH